LVTDGSGMLMTSLSSLLILEMFGFSPADYSKMPSEQKKATMRDATSGLSSKLVSLEINQFFLRNSLFSSYFFIYFTDWILNYLEVYVTLLLSCYFH
jgi:hypothetical protein